MGKHRGPRSSGSSRRNAAKIREAVVSDFKKWYFEENGDVLPDEMYSMLRRGFNMGWKAKKMFEKQRR